MKGGSAVQDAAKKALQNMFKDSRDVLAAYDDSPRGPGGRGRGKVQPSLPSAEQHLP